MHVRIVHRLTGPSRCLTILPNSFWAVLNLVSVIPSVMYMGDRPLITRLRGRRGEKSDAVSSSADDERGGDPPRVEEAAAPGTEESTKKESSKLQS